MTVYIGAGGYAFYHAYKKLRKKWKMRNTYFSTISHIDVSAYGRMNASLLMIATLLRNFLTPRK